MKRIISVFLILVLVLTLPACNADATDTASNSVTDTAANHAIELILGDADGDGNFSIIDATCIQRYLVELPVSNFNKKAAMVSDGKELSIIDATLIRRKLVNLIDHFPVEEAAIHPTEPKPTEEPTFAASEMKMIINNTPVTVVWEDNESVSALKEAVKNASLTIQMSMYGGFEQVGSLNMTLPRNDTRITTQPGDIVLYSGDQMVVFYDSNTWAYTRLGHINDKTPDELTALLSNGNVTITITY